MGQWIVGVMSFQKMYSFYGLKHHILKISEDVTDAGQTGLLQLEILSLAIKAKNLAFFFFKY